VSIVVGVFFIISLIAAFARTATPPCSNQTTSHSNDDDHASNQPAAVIATNGEPFPWNNIRLPDSIVPIKYELFMWPNLTVFQFDGNVSILLDVKKSTDFILFHSKELTVRSCAVTKVSPSSTHGEAIRVVRMLEYIRNEQIYLQLESDLMAGEKYLLLIKFNGTLTDSLAGFYRSSYDTKSGEKR